MLPTISTTTKTPIQKTAQKLHAIVLYEIADYPLLKVANGIGEWPGFDWTDFLCENYRYQIRIKERTWFSDYSLWYIPTDRIICTANSVRWYIQRAEILYENFSHLV